MPVSLSAVDFRKGRAHVELTKRFLKSRKEAVVRVKKSQKSAFSEIRFNLLKMLFQQLSKICGARGDEIKEEVTASIEGVIEGVSIMSPVLVKTQAEVKYNIITSPKLEEGYW